MIQDATRGAPDAPMPVRCGIYCRKSTTKNLDADLTSLDVQRARAEDFIRSQSGLGWIALEQHYDDGGFSGGTAERPALNRLLADVEKGKLETVVVYRVDRFSRSIFDFGRLMRTLNERNVALVSVTEPFNSATSAGRCFLNMLMTFAEYERETIRERTQHKMSAARRKGKWVGGHPLSGFDVDPKGGRLVVNPEEAERVRAIFDLYLEKQSLLAVVAELSRRGWQTKTWTSRTGRTRRGKPFDKVALSRLLTNPLYRGQVEYRGEIFEGEHQAIVLPETWERVQAMLAKHARAGGSEARNKHAALLKGVLRCGPCSAAMTPTHTTKGSKRYRYYACVKSQKEGAAVCPTRLVPAGEIERAVVDRIRGIGQDPGLVAAVIAQARERLKSETEAVTAERDARADEVRRVNAELRRLVGDAGDGNGSPIADRLSELHERLRAAETALAETETKLAAARGSRIDEADLTAALAAFDPVWDALFPRERERIVKLLLESIEIGAGAEEMRLNFRPSGIRTLAEEMQTEEPTTNGSGAPETATK